ncbi:hypothetical protein [uncultured Litoreibacter sp.]|uniref:hypothetical protein n=1 Tax=uncultured Litoreibacter sp. TaxID=1392394 RepID=UPI00262E68E7|nr:hypothetical protein [uncultured Litoreibacter sp.]
MLKPTLSAALAALIFTTQLHAAEDPIVAEEKLLVLGCLEQMENGTSWPECVSLMFQPCADEAPGSDPHAACLSDEREGWSMTVQNLQAKLIEGVTPEGRIQIIDLMGLWGSYVVQQCNQVAATKETGAESARLGCEISEFAGLAGEFAACLEGRSTAEYCEFKEE